MTLHLNGRYGATRMARWSAFALLLLAAGCGRGRGAAPPPQPARRFPTPIFDGLALGMERAEVARTHAIRLTLTESGRRGRVWVTNRAGEYSADLTFGGADEGARLARIDVHFGPTDATPDQFIARFERELGAPEARRRKADINAYGDRTHDQYETIWSDATQYVFLTERVPAGRRDAPPVYYLTIKKKEITATGPPTGYVPPPPPKGKDGKPIEESPF